MREEAKKAGCRKPVKIKKPGIGVRILELVLLLILIYGIYWLVINRDWLRDRKNARHEVERYGILWTTDLAAARQLAADHERRIMLVYLNSGDQLGSRRITGSVFPARDFKLAARTYIPLLCDAYEEPGEDSAVRRKREEIVRAYNLGQSYNQLLLLEADGSEVNRFTYNNEAAPQLVTKLAGGRFRALPAIERPRVRDPLGRMVSGKARQLYNEFIPDASDPADAADSADASGEAGMPIDTM